MPRNKAAIKATLPQIDFAADFHALSLNDQCALTDAAKACGYRKPPSANGSTARYFFAYLNRTPKTEIVHNVQQHTGQGWEDVAASTDRQEARRDLRSYRENDPKNTFRLIRRREAV
jgi:hypothetical protein